MVCMKAEWTFTIAETEVLQSGNNTVELSAGSWK